MGDGESETGPLATSWHINKFLNPARDGVVLPILHLNGYKIDNPTLLARISHDELETCSAGTAGHPILSRVPMSTACIRPWRQLRSTVFTKFASISEPPANKDWRAGLGGP